MASFSLAPFPTEPAPPLNPFFAYQRRFSRYVCFVLVDGSLSLLFLSASYRFLPCVSFPTTTPHPPLTSPPPLCRKVLFAPGPINQRQSWSLLCERLHRRSANTSFVRLRSERWPQANSHDTSLSFPPFSCSPAYLISSSPTATPTCPARWPVRVTQALFVTIARFVWLDFTSQTLPPWTPLCFQSLSASPSCFHVVGGLSCLLALGALATLHCFGFPCNPTVSIPMRRGNDLFLKYALGLMLTCTFFRLGWSILRDDPPSNSGPPAPDTDKRVSLFKPTLPANSTSGLHCGGVIKIFGKLRLRQKFDTNVETTEKRRPAGRG